MYADQIMISSPFSLKYIFIRHCCFHSKNGWRQKFRCTPICHNPYKLL